MDFYVIDQLSLAAVADAASSIIAAHKPGRTSDQGAGLVWGNLGILFLGIIIFFVGQSIWQDYGPESVVYKASVFARITVVAALLGFLALAGASLLLAA